MELVFQLGDPFERVHEDGKRVTQARCLLVGQIPNPVTIVPAGKVRSLGVRFRPHGAQAFLRFPLDEVACRILPSSRRYLGSVRARSLEPHRGRTRSNTEN